MTDSLYGISSNVTWNEGINLKEQKRVKDIVRANERHIGIARNYELSSKFLMDDITTRLRNTERICKSIDNILAKK